MCRTGDGGVTPARVIILSKIMIIAMNNILSFIADQRSSLGVKSLVLKQLYEALENRVITAREDTYCPVL